MTFAVLVFIFESIYRIRNAYSMRLVETPATISKGGQLMVFSPEQIDQHVSVGKRLVIFDNLVLNLNGYERNHPGGKFNLTHNLGRDISKFFFGGYKLVNVPKSSPYTHSAGALDIVKTLVVGVIKGQEHI